MRRVVGRQCSRSRPSPALPQHGLLLTLTLRLKVERQARTAFAASVLAMGCAKDKGAPTVPEFRETNEVATLQVPSKPVALDLRTYDRSNQAVHPDYAAPMAPWGRRYFYLALTPYPMGQSSHENPSLYASLDGVKWKAAPRAPMPLAQPREGHLSDPDVVHAPNGVLSPAVVRRRNGDWRMWSINAGTGCQDSTTAVELRRSPDGVNWSAPEPVALPNPAGQFAWHIDVAWIPSRAEYWALFPVKAPGTCATTAVFLATSSDGVTWRTLPSPVMTAGAIPAPADETASARGARLPSSAPASSCSRPPHAPRRRSSRPRVVRCVRPSPRPDGERRHFVQKSTAPHPDRVRWNCGGTVASV